MAGRGRFSYQRDPGVMQAIRLAGVEGKVRVLPAVMEQVSLDLMLAPHTTAVQRNLLAGALAKLEASGELKRLQKRWQESAGPN